MRKLTAILVLVCFVTAVFPVNLMALTCGADLNNDGFTDAQNETETCISYPVHNGQGDADFCPVQATNCEPEIPTEPIKVCLEPGYSYVVATDRCEKAPSCTTGTWDAQENACVTNSQCAADSAGISDGVVWWGMTAVPTPCTTVPGGSCVFLKTVASVDGQILWTTSAQFDAACNWVTTNGASADYLPLAPGEQRADAYGARTYFNNSVAGVSLPPDCGPGQFDYAAGVCTTPYTMSRECVTGTYNPTTGMCASDIYHCPLGDYSCFDTGGVIPQCSPNPCVDVQDLNNEVIQPPPDDSWLRDDGEVDDYGNCLGQLYIFSGKSARCRPPGYEVGQLNDCCESDDTLMDSKTGSNISTAISAIKTTYEMAQTAYYSYQIGSGAITIGSTAAGDIVLTTTATQATTTIAAGSEMAAGVSAAASAETGTAAVSAGLEGYTAAMINPATIAIAIAIAVAIKVLFGDGCDENDVQAAIFNESGYCHYLGDICVKKFKFIGCVQRAKRFCCFNSKMARIIAEQGRPQLKVFGPSGGWGTAENPNCRGFTPEEFQQLDFAKIDLTEYFGDIMEGMNQNIQEAQQRIEQGIQDHYEATQ